MPLFVVSGLAKDYGACQPAIRNVARPGLDLQRCRAKTICSARGPEVLPVLADLLQRDQTHARDGRDGAQLAEDFVGDGAVDLDYG